MHLRPTGHCILIAEDSQDDLNFLLWALKTAGILNPVRTVKTGDEAIAYLSRSGEYANHQEFPFPSILFLDWAMPGKTGAEVLTWLKQHHQGERVLVIVLTGQEHRTRIVDAYRLGADSFLTKPVIPQDLMNLITHFTPFWKLDCAMPQVNLAASEANNVNPIRPCP